MRDHTIEKYRELCSAIKGTYKTLTFQEYLNNLNFNKIRFTNFNKISEFFIVQESTIKNIARFMKNRSLFFKFHYFKNNFVILRHDVAKMPANALKTADVENEFGINRF